jgi:hypothetical protein
MATTALTESTFERAVTGDALSAKSLEQVIAAVQELDMDDVRAKVATATVATV